MAWFELPTGYDCVTRQSDTTLYAYGNGDRDTYTINGFTWLKTGTSSQSWSGVPDNAICQSTAQIPSAFVPSFVLVGSAFVLAFFILVYKIFGKVRL